METAGIKEFKAHLGRYLERVRGGEVILLTDRGVAVAELHPLSAEREAVLGLAREGTVRWSGRKPRGCSGCKVQGLGAAEAVLEDRR